MPVLTFEIETYTLSAVQAGSTAASGAYRVLGLTSTALSHGIRDRATIYFLDSPGAGLGSVFNVDQPNFNGRSAIAYCRKAEFAELYDFLRNERPVRFSCYYDGPEFDPSKPSRSIFNWQLYTGQPEPPGEGPEGVLALQARALATASAGGDGNGTAT